jgi:hypothetical protein
MRIFFVEQNNITGQHQVQAEQFAIGKLEPHFFSRSVNLLQYFTLQRFTQFRRFIFQFVSVHYFYFNKFFLRKKFVQVPGENFNIGYFGHTEWFTVIVPVMRLALLLLCFP